MPETLRVPVAEYAPDQPTYPGTGAAVVKNVYPRTQISYGPVGSQSAMYNALTARCRGGFGVRDKLGDTFIFAGDANDLYLMKAGLSAWLNVSLLAGGYAAGDAWRFTYFNGDVIATNYGNPPQYFTLIGGSAFADVGGTPPRAKFISTVKNAFVVLGNTYDSENGEMPQRVWWGAAGNAHDWPLLGSNDAAEKQSSSVDLLGPAGEVMGFAPELMNADAIVFQERGVRRMTYTGPPTTFSFLPVENARGCVASDSIVVNGGIAYYWGQDGIYAFDGDEAQPIGADKIDKTVYDDVDVSNLSRIVGVADPKNKLIIWAYPSRQNSLGNPDRLLIYNWQLDRWSLVELTCETLLKVLSIGYTLDELETILGYLTVDVIPHPLSSDVWQGGRPHVATFNTDHKLTYLTGTPLAATVDTAEAQPKAGLRTFIKSVRPLVDGEDSAPSVAVGRRERQQDLVSWSDAVALNAMGACPVRRSGRYITVRISVPESRTWSHISGVELDATPQGTR